MLSDKFKLSFTSLIEYEFIKVSAILLNTLSIAPSLVAKNVLLGSSLLVATPHIDL